MILKDAVTELILATDVFMTKKGKDLESRKNLLRAINTVTQEDSCDTIYVNERDHMNLPDVAVIPLYNKDFNLFLMDGDLANVCPFGYTVEINARCFDEFTAEELAAVIMHDILQNVQSCSAKTRFIKAYNAALNKYRPNEVLNIFDDISNSEVVYMAYVDICCRPFRVPTVQYDFVGTDEVLKAMCLADAYDSYLKKAVIDTKRWVNRDNFNDSPEAAMETAIKEDYRTLETIMSACMDHDIRHYYAMVRNGIPLVTLDHIFTGKSTAASLGFISRKRNFKRRYSPVEQNIETNANAITESFLNPKDSVELRFQIDKIIADMRYVETEAEKEVIMYKIKQMTLKLYKTLGKLQEKANKFPNDKATTKDIETVKNYIDELDMLRKKAVEMEVNYKKYGLFVSYPESLAEYRDNGPLSISW